ncbi:MAG: DUF3307 domain-containing protein [Leeuwenhoekiella sp.]
MIVLSLKLILAHIIGDFVLQPKKWVDHKLENNYKSPYLYWHVLIHVVVLFTLLQFDTSFWFAIVLLGVSHYAIDLLKLLLNKKYNEQLLFFLDQLAHLAILVLIVNFYEPLHLKANTLFSPVVLLFVSCVIFISSVASIVLQQILSPWDNVIKQNLEMTSNSSTSISGAGKIIGILERLFVFGFILLNAWSAIGFLIAAKSVFRFGDLSEGKNRQLTEYVLIGTLVSFGIAIIAGLIFNYLSSIL